MFFPPGSEGSTISGAALIFWRSAENHASFPSKSWTDPLVVLSPSAPVGSFGYFPPGRPGQNGCPPSSQLGIALIRSPRPGVRFKRS